MTQPTPRTGPNGLVRPTGIPARPTPAVDGDLEAAITTIRTLATRPATTVPAAALFSLETAKSLAEKAPDLYPMSAEVAARFHLIATFLDNAITEATR